LAAGSALPSLAGNLGNHSGQPQVQQLLPGLVTSGSSPLTNSTTTFHSAEDLPPYYAYSQSPQAPAQRRSLLGEDTKKDAENATNVPLFSSKAIIFHTSERDIAVVPVSKKQDEPVSCLREHPMTVCKDVLKQYIPAHLHHLSHFDRMNMLIHIPELSLVIVGSQVGRVALVTLTRPSFPIGKVQVVRPTNNKRETLGQDFSFRIDKVLPLRSQEALKQRPSQPLLGIAASPMRESERKMREYSAGGKRPTRFRLLLYYYDHTILSYELERDEGKELNVS